MSDPIGSITTPSTDYPTTVSELANEVVNLWDRATLWLTDNSSTANHIIAQTVFASSAAPGITTLKQGMEFYFSATVGNDDEAVDFIIDGMASAVAVKMPDGGDVPVGYIKAGHLRRYVFDGTNIVIYDPGSNVVAGSRAPDCIFEEQQSAGIDAGDSSTATADTRVLNTEVRNERGDVSLDTSTGEFTLGPGEWLVSWSAPVYGSGTAISELYNVTDSTSVKTGATVQSGTADMPYSAGLAVLDLAAAKTFRLRTKATTGATDGLGKAANLGLTEVYSRLCVTAIDDTGDSLDGTPGGPINEPYEYDDVDNDETDPGQGKFKTDDADLTAATELYLSKDNGDSNDISALLDSLGAGTSGVKATLMVHERDDRSSYARYTVGDITDNTTFYTLSVTWTDGPLSALADAAAVQFVFDRTGDAGTANNAFATVLATTVLAADTDDLDAGSAGRNVMPVATDDTGAYKINGIVPKATSEFLVVPNVDANGRTVTLADEAASSTAEYRIHTGTGADVVLEPGDSALLWYREAAGRWYIVGYSFGRDKREAGSDEYKELGDSDETLDETDGIVVEAVDFTAARTRTLPAAANCKPGQRLIYVDKARTLSTTNSATFVPTDDDTINGGSSLVFTAPGVVRIFITDGVSQWTAETGAAASEEVSNFIAAGTAGAARAAIGIAPGRNYVDNPRFNIWQRGTSFSITSSTRTVVADRWKVYRAQPESTVSRQTGFSGAQYCLRFGRNASKVQILPLLVWHQLHESVARGLAGRTVTLSFDVRAGADYSGAAINVLIVTGTGGGEAADLSSTSAVFATGNAVTTVSNSVTPTTTAQRVTATALTLGSSVADLAICFYNNYFGTSGAADYLEITNVKLEVGDVATEFVAPDVVAELTACQYTCRKIGIGMPTKILSSSSIISEATLQPPMRVAPTITQLLTNLEALFGAGATVESIGGAISLMRSKANGVYIESNGFGSLSPLHIPGVIYTENAYLLDAELVT